MVIITIIIIVIFLCALPVFVMYCCVTNYHKLSALKQHIHLPALLNQESGQDFWESEVCKAAIKVSARAGFSSEGLVGERPTSKVM